MSDSLPGSLFCVVLCILRWSWLLSLRFVYYVVVCECNEQITIRAHWHPATHCCIATDDAQVLQCVVLAGRAAERRGFVLRAADARSLGQRHEKWHSLRWLRGLPSGRCLTFWTMNSRKYIFVQERTRRRCKQKQEIIRGQVVPKVCMMMVRKLVSQSQSANLSCAILAD